MSIKIYRLSNNSMYHTGYIPKESLIPELHAITKSLQKLHDTGSTTLYMEMGWNKWTQNCTQDLRQTLQLFSISDLKDLENKAIQTSGQNYEDVVELLKYKLGLFAQSKKLRPATIMIDIQRRFKEIQRKYIEHLNLSGNILPFAVEDLIEMRTMIQILNFSDTEIDRWDKTYLERACLLDDIASYLARYPESWVKINMGKGKATIGKWYVSIN